MGGFLFKTAGLVLVGLMTLGCHNPASPTLTTGLTGIVLRGPITPVCQIQVPCDAPFSADFSVEQNGRVVSRFRSDQDGRFTVMLEPGAYRVVPASEAPIIFPASQAKTVTVLASGLTEIRLTFDTGLR
jgi:hypothetical protein